MREVVYLIIFGNLIDLSIVFVFARGQCYNSYRWRWRIQRQTWRRRSCSVPQVSSQFQEEYLDGRKSFIFSWDKKHRNIHVEALLHFFDSNKKGKKFEPLPRLKISTQSDSPSSIKVESMATEDEVMIRTSIQFYFFKQHEFLNLVTL